MEESIYERERREKLQKLRDMGVEPFGGRTTGLTPLGEIKAKYTAEMGHDSGPVVKGAGRIMQIRDHKKLIFITLRDESGDLQIGLEIKRLSEHDWKIVQLLDHGDQVVVEGPLGTTRKGEITIWATGIWMASKALASPPAKWEGLSDVELRYRQRYVDLWANPQVMRVLKLRIAIVEEIRTFLKGKGFVEVETPMMQPLAGGAAAKPFVTHHNALGIPLYMRIAPELYLKRLLVGGFTKVFELNRNFRNEGISPRHNPEFTMLEAYEAFGSWETMADLVEEMVCGVAEKLFGGLRIEHKGEDGAVIKTINLQRPWRRVRMVDLVEERTGWKFQKRSATPSELRSLLEHIELRTYKMLARQAAGISSVIGDAFRPANTIADFERIKPEIAQFLVQQLKVVGDELRDAEAKIKEDHNLVTNDEIAAINRRIQVLANIQRGFLRVKDQPRLEQELDAFSQRFRTMSPAEQLMEVYEKLIEHTLVDPTYVTHVPSVIIPLARKWREDDYFADVYELAINGQEISPGYTELNDPDVQAANFTQQVGDDQQQVDEDFLNALRYGMPPAGGMGLGIDRLVMMLTGAQSIRDVILFPLMKPQDRDAKMNAEEGNAT